MSDSLYSKSEAPHPISTSRVESIVTNATTPPDRFYCLESINNFDDHVKIYHDKKYARFRRDEYAEVCCGSLIELNRLRIGYEETEKYKEANGLAIVQSNQEEILQKKRELKAVEFEIDVKQAEMANLQTRSLKLEHEINKLEHARLQREELDEKNQARYEAVDYFLQPESKIFSGNCPLQFVRDTIFTYFPQVALQPPPSVREFKIDDGYDR